jgi:hypothetical protein
MTKLRRLDLSLTQVEGSGLAHLAGMDDLAWLNVSGTRLTDEGLKQLPAAKRLRWVDVGHTEVQPLGLSSCPGGKVKLELDGLTARLRHAASGEAIGTPLSHRSPGREGGKIVAWAFSPDGKLLVTAMGYESGQGKERESMGDIRAWEVATGNLLATREHGLGYVHGVAFLPDSKTLLFSADTFEVDGP